MKTREEIHNLKNDWKKDPCWDLEKTDGFEDHVEELKAFSEVMKANWAHEEQVKYETKLQMVMSFDAIHQARLAAMDEDWQKATAWAAIAQAEAMQKMASTVVPLSSGEFTVNTFDNSRDNF